MSYEFFEKFLEKNTPTGMEKPGQIMWAEEAKKYADVRVDVTGNVIATINNNSPTTIMLAGHCDEIGVIVTYVTNEGFVHFTTVGGIDITLLQGSKVIFDSCIGVIGKKPIHLQDDDDYDLKKSLKIKDLWIDIGAKDKAQALKTLPIGSIGCIHTGVNKLLNGLITSKGLDDKIGAYVVLRVLEKIKKRKKPINVNVVGVSTVQEEIGLFGSKVAAFNIKPQAAIAIDVGFATDTPDEDDKKTCGEVSIGKGPILSTGPAVNTVLKELLLKTASRKGIEIQLVADPGEPGTDADSMRLSRSGVATALVSVPVRYMHTPIEVCSFKDIEDAITLISDTIIGMRKDTDFSPF